MIESKSHTNKTYKKDKKTTTRVASTSSEEDYFMERFYIWSKFLVKNILIKAKKVKSTKKTKTNKENFWHITLWERGMYPDFTFDNGASIFFFFSLNYFESMNVCVIIFCILLLSLYIFGSFFFIFLWVTLNRWMFVSLLSFVCSFIIFLDLL